jgi:hypothetical protein
MFLEKRRYAITSEFFPHGPEANITRLECEAVVSKNAF